MIDGNRQVEHLGQCSELAYCVDLNVPRALARISWGESWSASTQPAGERSPAGAPQRIMDIPPSLEYKLLEGRWAMGPRPTEIAQTTRRAPAQEISDALRTMLAEDSGPNPPQAHPPAGAGSAHIGDIADLTRERERPRKTGAFLVFTVSTQCAPEETRTPNLLIRSQMLYPLSYGRLALHSRACQRPEYPTPARGTNRGQDADNPGVSRRSRAAATQSSSSLRSMPRTRGEGPASSAAPSVCRSPWLIRLRCAARRGRSTSRRDCILAARILS